MRRINFKDYMLNEAQIGKPFMISNMFGEEYIYLKISEYEYLNSLEMLMDMSHLRYDYDCILEDEFDDTDVVINLPKFKWCQCLVVTILESGCNCSASKKEQAGCF